MKKVFAFFFIVLFAASFVGCKTECYRCEVAAQEFEYCSDDEDANKSAADAAESAGAECESYKD